MYKDAKKLISHRGYTSMSELVRDALREAIYPEITENGFTPEFEKMVSESAKEPVEKSIEWDGKTPFTKFVLTHSKKKNGQNSLHRKISKKSKRVN